MLNQQLKLRNIALQFTLSGIIVIMTYSELKDHSKCTTLNVHVTKLDNELYNTVSSVTYLFGLSVTWTLPHTF